MGRPTKYRDHFPEQARKLCLLGATNEDLANFFEVTESTIGLWIASKPTFSDAIKRGRIVADAEVARSLYQRGCGYEHPEIDIRVIRGKIVKTKLTKYYPPDTAAAFIWLKNRRPEAWRDREKGGSGGGYDPAPTAEALRRTAQEASE